MKQKTQNNEILSKIEEQGILIFGSVLAIPTHTYLCEFRKRMDHFNETFLTGSFTVKPLREFLNNYIIKFGPLHLQHCYAL